jgi:hypothetical protein
VTDITRAIEGAWDQLLDLLAKIIIPDWNDVIGWLPTLMVIGVLGPILTLLFFYWAWVYMHNERPRIRYVEPEPVQAERNADGYFIVAANVPYCPRDGLIYPPQAVDCDVCRGELVVRCPVDETVRPAREEICRACGTRYVLGAVKTPLAVQRRRAGPPEGGAAAA